MIQEGEYPQAVYAARGKGDYVRCLLCPVSCRIPPSASGACGGRENIDGELTPTNYAKVTSISLDPIEKKPLYHFYPGSTVLSLGTYGCNMNCTFCQNWQISHPVEMGALPLRDIQPREVVERVRGYRDRRCIGAAYTYSEPVVWYEYVRDTSLAVREAGSKNILVTNAYLRERPWRELLKSVDACNIDVKGFDPEFYREFCAGDLSIVKRNVEIAVEAGVHVEVTTLIVPNGTDDSGDLEALSDWLAQLDPGIPLHLSRYYPHYRMHRPPTPMKTLLRAHQIAAERLNYVYLGNVLVPGGSDTTCACCGETLVRRSAYRVSLVGLDGEKCAGCGHPSGLIFEGSVD